MELANRALELARRAEDTEAVGEGRGAAWEAIWEGHGGHRDSHNALTKARDSLNFLCPWANMEF